MNDEQVRHEARTRERIRMRSTVVVVVSVVLLGVAACTGRKERWR
jgi:hypothetical protein